VGVGTFIAGQLRKPSGLFGRLVVARILNRANAAMNVRTVELLDLAPGDQVLEVGFGGGDLIGRMSLLVTQGRITGVDFSPEMVATCTKRFGGLVRAGRLELRCANVDALPYTDDAFTKSCTVNTIYFWPDPDAALGELRRTLRTGGRLVVCFNPKATAQKLSYTRHGFTLYEPDQVRRLLENARFRDVRMIEGTSGLGPFVCAVGVK
jgi:ubiquinone/menaquinone biosynthesis C-methylase UbiE